MKKVLFVCTHNAARSQMAEALLKQICGDYFESHSAGMKPTSVNPDAIAAMAEIGIDISRQHSKSVFEYIRAGTRFAYVITLCDQAIGQQCPTLPGRGEQLDWSFPDPSAFSGTTEERLQRTREVRDSIKQKLTDWCGRVCVPELV